MWKRRQEECKSQKGQRTAKGLLDTRGLPGVCYQTGHMLRFSTERGSKWIQVPALPQKLSPIDGHLETLVSPRESPWVYKPI
ncbi:rCG43074 [Rattus norvegicus]|uniref:RCG43074 n=1 Tax=Rattus norvegicus TaxID=10116 RepID=A6IVX9_RAT|nr:rCG43074 [Rattus norvegicus]